MSKIGKKPIAIPAGVEVKLTDGNVVVKGSKGTLTQKLHPKVLVEISDSVAKVNVKNPEDSRQKALWGTFRAILGNMIMGVNQGFEKKLEIIGVGYKSQISAGKLVLNLGYSHPIELAIPKDLEVKVEKNILTVSGSDKQAVGQFAAIIRSQRPPEPYKGKGVKYVTEVVRRKAGKVVKAVGG